MAAGPEPYTEKQHSQAGRESKLIISRDAQVPIGVSGQQMEH